MIELALRFQLLATEAIEAIIGNRCYIDLSPQNAPLPRIVLRLMPGSRREYHATAATDLVFADIECTIQAATYPACRELYDVIREALDKTSGTWDETTVDVARVTPPYSSLQLPVHGDEQGVSSLVCEIETAFRET